MSDINRAFIRESRRYLSGEYLPKIKSCLAQLSDEQIWWRSNAASNSIGNLLLHLSGNVHQWIVGGVGETPVQRQRQQEFDERRLIPRDELWAKLARTIAEADRVLDGVNPESLAERRLIQGRDVSVLEAVYHVVEHFSMHVGQIILLTKMQTGNDIAFYDVGEDGEATARWNQETTTSFAGEASDSEAAR